MTTTTQTLSGDTAGTTPSYRVRNYQTGALRTGTPSAELIEASLSEGSGTGAVNAYRDGDHHGVWQFVEASQADHYRRNLGCDVITVYVE